VFLLGGLFRVWFVSVFFFDLEEDLEEELLVVWSVTALETRPPSPLLESVAKSAERPIAANGAILVDDDGVNAVVIIRCRADVRKRANIILLLEYFISNFNQDVCGVFQSILFQLVLCFK